MISLFYIFLICTNISQADLPVGFERDISTKYYTHTIDFDRFIVLLSLMFIKYFLYFTLKYLGYGLRILFNLQMF